MTIPQHFDADQFCASGLSLKLSVAFAELPRVLDEQGSEYPEPGFEPSQPLTVELQGARVERRALPEYTGQGVLRVSVEGAVSVQCVRCLTPVSIDLATDRCLVLFRSDVEADAALLDDDRYDAVTGGREFDLRALIEDEVLMALPSDPAHVECPAVALGALGLAAAGQGSGTAAIDHEGSANKMPHPFAALGSIKRH